MVLVLVVAEEEGDVTGEQKGDGSPVEEGNGIGGMVLVVAP